MKKVTLMTV